MGGQRGADGRWAVWFGLLFAVVLGAMGAGLLGVGLWMLWGWV